MVTKEVLDRLLHGMAVEFKGSDGRWKLRQIVNRKWCDPDPSNVGLQVVTEELRDVLRVLTDYEWRIPVAPMGWMEACERLREGAKVKRAGWMKENALKWASHSGPIYRVFDHLPATLDMADYQANDWVVVNE